uniref:Uncharacterized protein n=1 Tax=Glossina pallidipes TaxID=7398 RepID=A0A1A9ZYU9_GLOPL
MTFREQHIYEEPVRPTKTTLAPYKLNVPCKLPLGSSSSSWVHSALLPNSTRGGGTPPPSNPTVGSMSSISLVGFSTAIIVRAIIGSSLISTTSSAVSLVAGVSVDLGWARPSSPASSNNFAAITIRVCRASSIVHHAVEWYFVGYDTESIDSVPASFTTESSTNCTVDGAFVFGLDFLIH